MNNFWPVPDCRVEHVTSANRTHLHIVAHSLRGRSGAELAAQLSSASANLPAAVPVLSNVPEVAKQRPPPVVQINFKASEAFADLHFIAREAEKAGSTRRLFARLMRDAGNEVPEADVNPPDNRRRRG